MKFGMKLRMACSFMFLARVAGMSLKVGNDRSVLRKKETGICSFKSGKKELDADDRMRVCEEEKNGFVKMMEKKRFTSTIDLDRTKKSCNECPAFCMWVPANEEEGDDGCCVNKFSVTRNSQVSFDSERDAFNKYHLCNDPEFVKQCASLDIKMWDPKEVKGWKCIDQWVRGCYSGDADYDPSEEKHYEQVRQTVRGDKNLQNLKKLTDQWKIDEIDLTNVEKTKKIGECEAHKLSPEEEAAKEAAKQTKHTEEQHRQKCLASNYDIVEGKALEIREKKCTKCGKCEWLKFGNSGCCVGAGGDILKNHYCGDLEALYACDRGD